MVGGGKVKQDAPNLRLSRTDLELLAGTFIESYSQLADATLCRCTIREYFAKNGR